MTNKKIKLNVEGMHCRSCEMLLQDVLDDIGVKSSFSHIRGEGTVEFDDSKVSLNKIKEIIRSEGHKVK